MARFKLKNHTGAAKRFRRTGTGKLVRRKAGMRHILTSKSSKRKTRLMRESQVSAVDSGAINRLLPY